MVRDRPESQSGGTMMASIVIKIEDSQLQRVLDRFAQAHGYQDFVEQDPTLPPIPNAESRLDFLRRLIVERIRRTVLDQEVLNESKAFQSNQPDPGVS